ncbi:hypothetical protein [Streptomyces sp. NBC_00859]|uniref:hypothetical protein n=1 Tax=Streptomyces sp. NBC_00859 TaxID=2903682 RepID=UPI00386C5FC4|nr:hypothetical protein OG584_00135 [Streptomyces sp. NBC_00859]WSZ86770.1 hypothetical protein OG584_35005 [Streptomyces sp. NBC_00859]
MRFTGLFGELTDPHPDLFQHMVRTPGHSGGEFGVPVDCLQLERQSLTAQFRLTQISLVLRTSTSNCACHAFSRTESIGSLPSTGVSMSAADPSAGLKVHPVHLRPCGPRSAPMTGPKAVRRRAALLR